MAASRVDPLATLDCRVAAADILHPDDIDALAPQPAPPKINLVLAEEAALVSPSESARMTPRRGSFDEGEAADLSPSPGSPGSKKWKRVSSAQKEASVVSQIVAPSPAPGDDADPLAAAAAKKEARAGIIARAFGDGSADPFGMASGKRKKPTKPLADDPERYSRSLLADYEPGMPLPGMLIAVLSLFDTDGTYALSEEEWLQGNAALELQTSKKDFRVLRESLGKGAKDDELNFAKAMGIYGSRKPVEGYLEDVLRRLMKAIVSLTSKVGAIQSVLDRTVLREEIERKGKISKILRYWAHKHTSVAFDGWRDVAKQSQELRNRSARHWKNALVASVWRRWAEMVDGVKAQREAVAAAVGRWKNRLAASMFLAWTDAVRDAVEERHSKLAKAAGRMQNRQLGAAFDTWADASAQGARVRELQRRALLRMSMGVLGETFWAWQESVVMEAERRASLLKQIGMRLRNRCVVLTFEAWHQLAKEHRDGRDAQYAKAIGRFRNRSAQMVFETWCAFVAWRRRIFQRAAFAIGPGRSMWLAWRTWASAAHEAKKAEQKDWLMSILGDTLPELVASALRSVVGGDLAAELKALKERTMSTEEREARDRQHRISKILRYWAHKHTSVAFDAWREMLEKNKRLLEGAARRWQNGLVASVWRRWAEMVDGVKAQREAVAAAVGRWKNRLAAAAFQQWLDSVSKAIAWKRGRLSKAIGRMQNRVVSLTFEAWQGLISQAKKVREMQRRALLRMTMGVLGETFWAWQELTGLEVERRARLLRKVGARIRNRCVVLVYEAWHQLAKEHREGRQAQYAKAIGRFRNRSAQMVFETWCAFVAWRRRIFQRAAFAIGPGRSMWLAWRTWVSIARLLKQEEQRSWVLSMLGDTKEWLAGAVREVLPSLLPDSTSILSSIDEQLQVIGGMQHELKQKGSDHERRLEEQAKLTEASAAALGEQLNETRRLARELESQSELSGRLFALVQALEASSGRWDTTSDKVEREVTELRAMSTDASDRLHQEMATTRRFVIEQTKSYLKASAGSTAGNQMLEAQLTRLSEENRVLVERLRALEVGLETAAPHAAVLSLSQQLQELARGTPSIEHVQEIIDQVQRPAVVVSKLDRGSLGDFLSQVEERYVGFIELLRVSHAQSTLWSRTGSLTLGPGSVPFQLSNSNNSNNSRRSTSPEHTKAAAEAALLQPPKQMRMAATATRGPGASLLDGVGLAPPPRESQQAVLLAAKTPPPPQQDQGGVAAPEGLGPWASST